VALTWAGSPTVSNRRRRTISNASSAATGFQTDSTRPKYFSSTSSARWPCVPAASVSDCGSEASNIALGTAFIASVSAWMKLMLLSKVPPG
jgi:hypothetical protein